MRLCSLLLLAWVSIGLAESPEAVGVEASPLIGRVAPGFTLTDANGNRLSLGSLKGKTILLDFWATWCPPCREELPVLSRIAQSIGDKELTVLGIDASEDPDTVRRFLSEYPVSFRTLLTYDDESALKTYEVRRYPLVVLIDRNGIVADVISKASSELDGQLRSKLQTLMAADYVSPVAKSRQQNDVKLSGLVYPNRSMPGILQPALQPFEEHYMQASLDFRMRRLDEAMKNVDACLEARADWPPALRLRARIYAERGKFKEATADLTQVLAEDHKDPEVFAERARLFEQQGQPDRAISDWKHQLDLEPQNAETWVRLGAAYLQTRQLEPAQKALDRAIELSPDNVAAYQARARLEKQRGDWQSELQDLHRMLTLDPGNKWAKTYKPDVILRLAASSSPLAKDDVYAVYSAVLAHPVWDHVDDDSLLLISEETGATYGGMEPANCIQPPAEYRTAFDEVLSDYAARKDAKARLEPRFYISRPYRLLNSEEGGQSTQSRFQGKEPGPELAALFRQTPDLFRLSQVFFNHDHTLAMVLVSNYCGGLCGGEKWRVLVKRNGAWVDEDWTTCETIS
jgi:cytochrome c biogenesis protein CcmG, thiol:disulfide interchange protein DsbE